MFTTILCVAYACLSISAATESFLGCNITKLMTPSVFGIKPTFHLVNKKYGKVQRSSLSGTEACSLTFTKSDKVLSAQLYGYDESGPTAKLIQDHSSNVPEQQWSIELATDTDAQFNRLDQNNDGELTLEECGNVTDPLVLQNDYTYSYHIRGFTNYDNNSDGFVTKDEEKAYWIKYSDERKYDRSREVLAWITGFDENNDTMLQSDELKLFLATVAEVLTKDSFGTTFGKYDENGDNGLDVDEMGEYLNMIQYEMRDFISIRYQPPFDKASTLYY
uniref:EF-hand domain-containing protein n=1 Tax=Plectus sambesii TaxID=2011161 RepID=A0A914VXG6_9BILA